MNNKNIYKIWAPTGKRWVDWVRPVPFMSIGEHIRQYTPSNMNLLILDEIDLDNTAIILDLPDCKSVDAGIILAEKYGYRPIPIYNGVIEQDEASATTDNTSISNALVWGAYMLSKIKIDDCAKPAFLTDTNRLDRRKIDESVFDNSWDVYPQDLPSEKYFLDHGITKILIISDKLAIDLKRIFKEYPKKEIKVYLTDGYDKPRRINIKRKLFFKSKTRDD